MNLENEISTHIRKLNLFDFAVIKLAYFSMSALVYANYDVLSHIDWWAYLILAAIAALPLYVHLFSFSGSYIEKTKKYIRSNMFAYQILFALSVMFFSFTIFHFLPFLFMINWIVFVCVIAFSAINTLYKMLKS